MKKNFEYEPEEYYTEEETQEEYYAEDEYYEEDEYYADGEYYGEEEYYAEDGYYGEEEYCADTNSQSNHKDIVVGTVSDFTDNISHCLCKHCCKNNTVS